MVRQQVNVSGLIRKNHNVTNTFYPYVSSIPPHIIPQHETIIEAS